MMTATATAPNAITCPKCGGPCWDERAGRFWGNGLTANGKQKPTHKCKNKECGGAVWAKDAASTAAPRQAQVTAPAPTKQPHSIGTTGVASLDAGYVGQDSIRQELEAQEGWADLRRKYGECFTYVINNVVPVLETTKVGASPESVAAATATLFIQRMQKGV